MKLITLNKCLSGLDTIVFHNYDEKNNNIRTILNDSRKYIIEFKEEHKKIYNKHSFIVILQFINYLVQESFTPITFRFINLIIGLRFLIIRFDENILQISDDYIDFDEECNTFLRKYLESEGDDEDDEQLYSSSFLRLLILSTMYYQIISILFLIQYNNILSRLSSV